MRAVSNGVLRVWRSGNGCRVEGVVSIARGAGERLTASSVKADVDLLGARRKLAVVLASRLSLAEVKLAFLEDLKFRSGNGLLI